MMPQQTKKKVIQNNAKQEALAASEQLFNK